MFEIVLDWVNVNIFLMGWYMNHKHYFKFHFLCLQDQESMDTQDIHQEIPDVVIEINVNTEEMAAAQEGTTHVSDR